MSSQVAPTSHGIVIIGGGLAFLKAVKDAAANRKHKVTAVCGSSFLEFAVASTVFLTRPEMHDRFLCQDPKSFQEKGVEYIFDVVEEIVPSEKKIRLAKGNEIGYSIAIVATGNKLSLLTPAPGQSLQERKATVQQAGAAIRAAKTIVVNGAGAVGLEMAGDAKLANPGARVVLLSRSGEVLATSHPDDWQQRVKAKVQQLGVEVMKATVTDPKFSEYKLSPGTLPLVDGPQGSLDFDVYIPAYMQGPNTGFLAKAEGMLNAKGQLSVNSSLQSTAFPEVFAVGVGDTPVKQPYAKSVADHAAHAVSSAVNFLEGKPLKPFANPGNERPMNVVLAHGKGGYLIWDTDQLPLPVKCCCCLPCGGGFPFCPPPCCWCQPGCSGLCGSCGSCGAEGEGAAVLHNDVILFKFAESMGFKGMGAAPAQQAME